ncbi:c-type cytochrome [Paraliomyxa miuraensis]|uniref:c-type cytochrome n=1 Tax=Paraliomyxa miuraensis TaxID=376150 RepID=UPI00225AC983|nr:c-type cytochrome [Paraliomyxa miuraensis]MCX4247705.1 c-type cytochrome [Paraliomyxa miuraensis]
MSTTLSMWLGIAFLLLAIIAVLLQAWLWGPKFWDDQAKKTRAPKFWLRMHALAGYSYGVIYLIMMYFMLPRLWEYQYELPARTVIHAVLAIAIGVLLITKIVILLFFRHFEEAMPQFGFGLLLCTVAMITLSVPYALRAHDLEGRTTDPGNVERVRKLLAEVEMEPKVDVETLVTAQAFERGREVLVRKCITCHDMRTVLATPRTASGWYKVNDRMLDKPAVFGERLEPEDVPYVTAYLVAITPEIQESAKQKREQNRMVLARTEAMVDAVHDAEVGAAIKVDQAAGEALLQAKCVDCHELDEVEKHGGDDIAGWRSVIAAMVEEGTELTDDEATLLTQYLTVKYPAKAEPAPPMPADDGDGDGDGGDEAVIDDDGETPAGDDGTTEGTEATPTEGTETTPTEGTEATPTEAQPKPKPKKKKPKPKGDRAAGRALFMAKCKSCHGADGKGDTPFGQKIGIVSLHRTGRSFSQIRSLTAKGVPGTKMKPYEGKLSDKELDDVSAFVKSLR